MTLGLTLGLTLSPTLGGGATTLSNVEALFIGDSNAFQMIEDDSGQAFIDECAAYGITATVTDGATSGSTLLKSLASVHWWVDDDDPENLALDVTGGRYQANIAGLANKNDITDIFCSLTVNDLLTTGTQDAGDAQTAYQFMIDEFFRLLPSLERFFIVPLFRPASASNYDEWAAFRQVEENLVANNANVYRAGEAYHLEMADSVHLNNASELVRQEICATALAGVGGNTAKKGLGMVIETAQIVDDGILLNITHKDGTDWTLPADSTNTTAPFGLYNGSTRLTGISGDIMSKVSATQAKITCNPITNARVVVVDGHLSGMGGTDVDPNVAYDNSPLQLPFGRSTPTITYADPLLGLAGIDVACKPSFTKTYSSGTLIDTVTSVNADTWSPNDTGNRMEYDATAFGGAGGFVSSGQAYRLEVNELLAEQFLYMCVIDVPASPTDDINVLEFGVSGTPGIFNRTYIDDADGHLKHRAVEGSTGTGTISAVDYRGQTLALIINARTQDAWDFYINSDTVTATFDVNNNYTGRTNVYWGGGDATYGAMYLRIGEDHGESGDLSIAQIKAQLESAHNL